MTNSTSAISTRLFNSDTNKSRDSVPIRSTDPSKVPSKVKSRATASVTSSVDLCSENSSESVNAAQHELIAAGPRSSTALHQRSLRQKFHRSGLTQLSDTELLALLFGGNEVAAMHQALQCLELFGSLSRILTTKKCQLSGVSGIGDARYIRLQVSRELVRRSVLETLAVGDVLSSPGKVREFLALELSGLGHEEFAALLLDNRHRVIEYRVLFTGTIDGAAVYPREVLKHCLELNAAAVIFAHNHPSGLAEPSDADIDITKKLTAALALVDIRVLDHLIIGQGVQTSLAERGLM